MKPRCQDLNRLERMGWESDGSTIGSVIVEVWEEPTCHLVHVNKLLSWLKAPGKFPSEEQRKAKLRVLAKWRGIGLDTLRRAGARIYFRRS